MDKIAAQLTDLILGAVPTMVILVVLYIFLKAIFFNPLEKLLKDRHAATEGSQHEAQKSVALAEAKTVEYAAALERARADVHRNREAARQEALKARAELVEKNRAAAKARIESARSSIESDVAAARERLAKESETLADSIAGAILR